VRGSTAYNVLFGNIRLPFLNCYDFLATKLIAHRIELTTQMEGDKFSYE